MGTAIQHELYMPPALPPAQTPSLVASAARGYQALRQRWVCMGPRCLEREGLRSWCKLPARIQLQQGWCCGPECFQDAFRALAVEMLHAHAAGEYRREPRRHRIPLGLLLLSRGQISREQLSQSLEAQAAAGHGRIGDWLVRHGVIQEDDVAAGVGLQWARPIFRLAQSHTWKNCRGWVPPSILESLRMLPLHFAPQRRRLYVGFSQTIDCNALAALASVFECKTESCIVTDSALDAVFEQIHALPADERVQDIAFERVDDPAEIAGIVRQYARHAEARQIRLAMMGSFLWVRVRGQRIIHITFHGRS